MKSRGAIIAFDSNARRRLWPSDGAMKAAMIEGYKVCTLALPTFSDDQALFGDATPTECAKRIAGYGVKEIVVKDGGNPCVVALGADLFSVAPEPVQDIVDTTGAGDSFNAGYIAARMSNREPWTQQSLATALRAGLSVSVAPSSPWRRFSILLQLERC